MRLQAFVELDYDGVTDDDIGDHLCEDDELLPELDFSEDNDPNARGWMQNPHEYPSLHTRSLFGWTPPPRKPGDVEALADELLGQMPPLTRVCHAKFGYGTVAEVEGDHIRVSFDGSGKKWIVRSKLSAIDDQAQAA